MSNPAPHLTDAERAILEERADQFFDALKKGPVADWEPFLTDVSEKLRAAILIELVIMDMSHWWSRGKKPRVEEYVVRFPELGPTKRVPPKLILEEHRCRMQAGEPADLDGYRSRFPTQFEVIQPELEVSGHATQISGNPPAWSAGSPSGVMRSDGRQAVSQEYEFVKELGRGMFGEVWLARKKSSGIEKAIKILLHPADRDAAKRELRSLELIKNLRHPYLLATEDFWVADNRLHIVMELADSTLRTRFKECRRDMLPGVPEDELLRYFVEAAEGLDYLHTKKITHRDVKPDNILILNGHAKVADFGLARHQDALMQSMSFAGTPAYMAPEIWGGEGGPASDQYSLAFAYAEVRQGKVPIPAKSTMQEMMIAHLDGQFEFDLVVSPTEQEVLRKAMARIPEERYPSCSAFAEALSEALGRSVSRKSAKIPMPASRVVPQPPPRPGPGTVVESTDQPVVIESGPTDPPRKSLPAGLTGTRTGNTSGTRPGIGSSTRPGSGTGSHQPLGSQAGMGTKTGGSSVAADRPPSKAHVALGPPQRPKPKPHKPKVLLAGGITLALVAVLGGMLYVLFFTGGTKPEYTGTGPGAGPGTGPQPTNPGGTRPTNNGNPILPPKVVLPANAKPSKDTPIDTLADGRKVYEWIEFSGAEGLRFRLIKPIGGPVRVDPFYISESKVPTELFRAKAGELPVRPQPTGTPKDAPVVNVTAPEAAAFAQKVFGGRLPTPSEWDHAAGFYQPGNLPGPTLGGGTVGVNLAHPISPTANPIPDRNKFDLLDMAGNGTEWTRAVVRDMKVVENVAPTGPKERVVLRGRRYTLKDALTYDRLKYEHTVPQTQFADYSNEFTGFRVVVPIP